MSAPYHLPQRHPNYLPRQGFPLAASPPCAERKTRSPHLRASIADRISQLVHEIEVFLMACTHEEMCSFWQAITHLRQYLHRNLHLTGARSEIPCFLDCRRKNRDFCRILEVLADLNYPKMHLSNSLGVM